MNEYIQEIIVSEKPIFVVCYQAKNKSEFPEIDFCFKAKIKECLFNRKIGKTWIDLNLEILHFYFNTEIVNNAYFVNDFFGDKEIIIRAFYPDFSKSFSDIFSNYCICDVKEGNKFIISHIDSISMDDTFVDTFLLVKELDLFDKTISKIINRIENNEEYKVVEQFKKVLLDKQDDKIFMDYVKKINIFPSKRWTLL